MMRSHSIGGSRRGATLVEVLMALLVMAVGVVSVFTLFPLSIMRSIKANQLTNAKLVEENARQIILANPQLVTGAPPWTPGSFRALSAPYVATGPGSKVSNAWVTPRARPGRALPESNLLYYAVPSASNPEDNDPATGTTSTFEPKWNSGSVNWTGVQSVTNRGGYRNHLLPGGYVTSPPFPSMITDGTLRWFPYRHSRYPVDFRWSMYVVDPIGWYEMDDSGANYRDRFGDLDRIHCNLSPTQASEIFASNDTWSPILEATVPVSITIPGPGLVRVQFETQVDLTQSRNGGRLIFLSDDGRRSLKLDVDSSLGNNNLNGSLANNEIELVGTLPVDFDSLDPAEIATARIDAKEQRYSWMMTVLMGPRGEAKIACIVFHNRSFNPLDEESVSAEFQGSRATLSWPATRSAGDLPIKEGGFVFDAVNGHWYRIQKVVSYDNTVTPRVAVLDLDTTVTVSSTLASGAAIVLPNIVKIFHLDME